MDECKHATEPWLRQWRDKHPELVCARCFARGKVLAQQEGDGDAE